MFDAIQSGLLPTSSGSPYKPSTLRGYRLHYRNGFKPSVGSLKIDRLSPKLVDDLAAEGSSSSVRNALMPLRLIVRFALQRDLITANPFQAIQLPAKHEEPVRVLSVAEANSVVVTLADRDRAVFATACSRVSVWVNFGRFAGSTSTSAKALSELKPRGIDRKARSGPRADQA